MISIEPLLPSVAYYTLTFILFQRSLYKPLISHFFKTGAVARRSANFFTDSFEKKLAERYKLSSLRVLLTPHSVILVKSFSKLLLEKLLFPRLRTQRDDVQLLITYVNISITPSLSSLSWGVFLKAKKKDTDKFRSGKCSSSLS